MGRRRFLFNTAAAALILFILAISFGARETSSYTSIIATKPETRPTSHPQPADFEAATSIPQRPPARPTTSASTTSSTTPTQATKASTSSSSSPSPTRKPLKFECPPSWDRKRYDYLTEHASNNADPKIKYFFALNLFNSSTVLPTLLSTLRETIKFLGPQQCALSIVEGRSTDGTREALIAAKEDMAKLGVHYYLDHNPVEPWANGTDRIVALSALRNHAIAPLVKNPELYSAEDTTAIFINDVFLCTDDLLELIHQRRYQGADMTCAMDWFEGGHLFYDVWVARTMSGDTFFEIPQSGTWEFAENILWNERESRIRQEAHVPYQVYSCWNGMVAFTATPFLKQQVKFRLVDDGYCFMGEPTTLCNDFWLHNYTKIAVVPAVNLGYDTEDNGMLTKKDRGFTSDLVAANKTLAEKISWSNKPPGQLKCFGRRQDKPGYPDWNQPSWVPSLYDFNHDGSQDI